MATIDTTLGPAVAAPGPRGLPLLGCIPQMTRDAPGFVTRVSREFGPVARFRLGPVMFNLVSDPDGIRRVLQEHAHNYVKGPNWAPVRQLVGDGLFGGEGASWLRQRRLAQPAFHRSRVTGFGELMVHETEAMLDRWAAVAEAGGTVEVDREMTALTMAIIAGSMFHTRIDTELPGLSDSVRWLLDDLDLRMLLPMYPGLRVPTIRNRRARRELARVRATIGRIIEARRQASEPGTDLLAMLMEARDADTGEAMTDRQLADELLTFFVAGHETTAVLLAWLCIRLDREPEWDERLAAEAWSALGDRPAGAGDLAALPLLGMAIDEALRLYPPAWMTSRTAIADDVVSGFRVRAGEVTGISPYATHRLESWWPDPERFDPMRFAADQVADRPRFAYLPFGGGGHQCIGNQFALVEARLIMATLLRRFRLRRVDDAPVAIARSTTLRPAGPVRMRPEPRRRAAAAAA